MEDGLLSLKWNNHKSTFFEILKLLRDKSNYTDATLAVEGKFYPVHKLVLSTCSEYFFDIFERTPCKSPVIVLKDVRSQDLESLLDYMYLGEVNVNQNDLAHLLKTAECLRIKGLAVPDEDPSGRVSSGIKNKISPDDSSSKDAPPSKRRKEDTSITRKSPPPSIAAVATSIVPPPSNHSSNSHIEDTNRLTPSSPSELMIDTRVKVEIEEEKDGDSIPNIGGYDSGEDGEYPEKPDVDSSYKNDNFSLHPQQNAGDLSWDEADSNFPNDSYGGDGSVEAPGGNFVHWLNVQSATSAQNPAPQESVTGQRTWNTGYMQEGRIFDSTTGGDGMKLDHVCRICGKRFTRNFHLLMHERTHTGEKPFQCPFCVISFTQKGNMRRHIHFVHKVAPLP